MKRILLCEDNTEAAVMVSAILKVGQACHMDVCATGSACLERYATARAQDRGYDLVLLDLGLPDLDGLEVLRRLRVGDPAARVIILTASDQVELAVGALRAGAIHYIRKPFRSADLRAAVDEALGPALAPDGGKRAQAAADDALAPVSKSAAMRAAYDLVDRIAGKNVAVLVQGPTGSGKEQVARMLHAKSGRAGPLVAVSCPAIPANLAESVLFGHEKGAFTGAAAKQLGKLPLADGGTLFLDEVADLTPEIQVKLLRALQEREVEPVGAARPTPVDVRIIAASSRSLRAEIAAGRFREDLFYRLADVAIELPALKDRAEDLPDLARVFAREYAAHHGEAERELAPELLRRLAAYNWPGNVRELRSFVRRLMIMAPLGGPVQVDAALDQYLRESGQAPAPSLPTLGAAPAATSLVSQEIEMIKRALAESDQNVTRAAKVLQIGRATLYRKMKLYGLAS